MISFCVGATLHLKFEGLSMVHFPTRICWGHTAWMRGYMIPLLVGINFLFLEYIYPDICFLPKGFWIADRSTHSGQLAYQMNLKY